MKGGAALASCVAMLVVGCSTAPVDMAERSLCSLAVFSFETLKGTAHGAATGFVAAARAGNCSDPKVCTATAAIATTGGAAFGAASGVFNGIGCARECWRAAAPAATSGACR